MSAPEVLTCPPERYRDFVGVLEVAFAEALGPEDPAMFEALIPPERLLTAIDGEKLVASAGVMPFRLRVPGGDLNAAGITIVAVLPSHRRRGLLTQMMGRLLDDAYRRGEPIAALWASEASIYQRFGYGLGALSARLDVDTTRTAFLRPRPARGSVRLVTAEEALAAFPPIYERVRRERAGMFTRTKEWWQLRTLADHEFDRPALGMKFFALYEGETGPEGYAVYRIKADWDETGPRSEVRVVEALATGPEATSDLWRWLFDLDLVRRLRARLIPVDHPLRLLALDPRAMHTTIGDGLWIRLVDVAAALAARRYEADGTLALELRDERCPWNAGRWRLEVEDGRGRLKRAPAGTNGEMELSLDIADLAAVYLGAFTFLDLAAAGRVTELAAGAIERASALFRTSIAPWCAEVF